MRRNKSPRFTIVASALLAAATSITAALGTSATAAPAEARILGAGSPNAIAGSYIVVFKDSAVPKSRVGAVARDLAGRYGGKLGHQYRHALRGMEVRLTETQAKRLAADPSVKYVEQNATVSVTGTQTDPPSWGLDRIDQRNWPLDSTYTYANTATNVRIYVIDTGIRTTHAEFAGRAIWGANTTGDGINTDCYENGRGHGTHVAGTAAGATYGVAKGAQLTAVKVLKCDGLGTWDTVIAGVDWVTSDHEPSELAVANMSLGTYASQAVDDAVTTSTGDGVTYVVSAGNEDSDACTQSPASNSNAITVGASSTSDERPSYSNWGTCLDLFAPGDWIRSAFATDDTRIGYMSGTSMASPHVAGVAAMVLSTTPSFTPRQVHNAVVNGATNDALTNVGPGSPNKLLFAGAHTIAVPNVLYMERQEAIRTLAAAGLAVVETIAIDNTCTYNRQVKAQSPAAGTAVPPGSAVTITVAMPSRYC
ncbi:S8 family serine peptidase [Streptomyces chryseus]